MAGKGGVGRTTVAAALALRATAEGRRVLAIDSMGTGDLGRLLEGAGTDDQPEVLRLTTGEALDQYITLNLRLPVGPRRLGPLARIFDYVSTAAPGVREILVIGKIGWEVRTGDWDEVVVDGPATGHLVELLDAPRAMSEIVTAGPIANQTTWLGEILAAPTTGVMVVTTPDELAVSETFELLDRLEDETATAVNAVAVNRVPTALTADGIDEAERLGLTDEARVEGNEGIEGNDGIEGIEGNDIGPARALAVLANLARQRHLAASLEIDRLRRHLVGLTDPPFLFDIPERWDQPLLAVLGALDAHQGW